MKQYYQMKSQEAINLLHSDDLQGLSSVEASTRLERYGDNVLKQKNKGRPLRPSLIIDYVNFAKKKRTLY